jgi:cobalt-zinc-cadmium efflux system outer membrane protein
MFGISVSVPLFDRNKGAISAARAEQRAAEARLTGLKLEVQADRSAAQARLTASITRTRAADNGVASAEEAYRLARAGFDAGRISQLELRSIRSALIAARNTAVDARIARVRAEVELARLDGRTPF